MTDDVALESDGASTPDAAENAVSEKTLPVSRVEELVKKAKLKGRDSMQAELDALKAENAALKNNGSMGGMQVPVDVEAIKKEVFEGIRRQMAEASEQRAQEDMEKEAKKIADLYHSKMTNGKESFEDFDDVMADFNPAAFPNLVFLASQVDNLPAVMYELNKNPAKLAAVTLMSERDPRAAQNMLAKISNSIKANDQAKAEEKNVPPPLGRLSSSPTGQDSGKPSSVKDFKRMFRG